MPVESEAVMVLGSLGNLRPGHPGWHRHGGNTPFVGKPPGLLEVGQEMLASTRLGNKCTESSDERS